MSRLDAMIEDALAAERDRILAEIRKAAVDASPGKDFLDYMRGFQDGANFVAEAVLKATVFDGKEGT